MSTDHPVGATLRGGYRVIDVLRGGMGVVYICHQEATDQLYAVKTVRFDGAPDDVQGRLTRFGSEVNHWIRISRESTCDKIVTALAFDADERLLILEFIDGLPLSSLVRPGQVLHPRHFIDWARDIATAMHELHSRFRLIHRDLKPANVLVERKDLTAKVTDLGIGKVLEGADKTHTLIGTPKFMAPECFTGRASFRSDVYSYGATLFWMLTLEHAVALEGTLEEVPGSVPPRMRSLIEQCLQRDPEKRPESFDEVLRALSEVEDLAAFSFDADAYRFCETHGFHSPLPTEGDEEGEASCLFCVRQAELDRQITSTVHGSQVEAESSATGTVERSDAEPRRPAATGTAFMKDALLKGPRVEAPPEKPPRKSPRRAFLLGGAAVATVAAGWYLASLWGGGNDVDPNGEGNGKSNGVGGGNGNGNGTTNGGGHAATDGTCAHPGCDASVASSARFETFRASSPSADDWKSTHCPTHSPFVCPQCTRRHTEAETVRWDERCASCGHDGLPREGGE